jgi:hypothetical protein
MTLDTFSNKRHVRKENGNQLTSGAAKFEIRTILDPKKIRVAVSNPT